MPQVFRYLCRNAGTAELNSPRTTLPSMRGSTDRLATAVEALCRSLRDSKQSLFNLISEDRPL